MKYRIFIFSFFLYVFLWIVGSLSILENIAIALFVYFLLIFLENLGKRIVILELTIMMAALTCLLMPVIFYHQYTIENKYARVWGKFMPIASDEYFSYIIPAIIALAVGLRIPLGRREINKKPRAYMENVQKVLATKPNLGLILIAVGVVSGLLDFLSPDNLKQVFYFLDHLTFVGVFYVIYSPSKHKKIVVPSVVALMIGQALITGMFGELIFILACSMVLILLGRKITFNRKMLVAISGIVFIIIIQSVKMEYREKVWTSGGGADPVYYAQLISERILEPSSLLAPGRMFFIAVRLNQGWLVAMTMNKVPAKYSFANGETIWMSIAAAIVPRFLWPDKPETGGKANLRRFWGFKIQGYSMNLGPFGEGYANFNTVGGMFYMFFYGLFFNFMLTSILKLAEKRSTIILWIPFLFYYSIGVETDLLSTMGSLLKGIIFTWIIFKVFEIAFRIEL